MEIIDRQFLDTPWYGSRQMTRFMQRQGHKCGRHRVRRVRRGNAPLVPFLILLTVEAQDAGFGHRRWYGVKTIERADVRNQARAPFLEHLPDRLVRNLGVFVRSDVGKATIFEPCIQLSIGLELRARHEEPSAQDADLVLDLIFLLTRGRSAGDRINQIMPTNLLE